MGMTVLALGGGAPNFTLMTGALLALDEAGVKIDRISMAGGGSVVGLLYMAPKGGDRRQALENTVNFGVSDLIYSMFPVNYKLFQKPGPAADRFRAWFATLPGMQRWLNQYGMSDAQKLYSDWLQFMAATMCPSSVTEARLPDIGSADKRDLGHLLGGSADGLGAPAMKQASAAKSRRPASAKPASTSRRVGRKCRSGKPQSDRPGMMICTHSSGRPLKPRRRGA